MNQLPQFNPIDVISVILGGGEGSRLYPLTKERAKPAVPLAGKFRFVDIPISLSINSGVRRIFLITQYLSTSLHRHVQTSYQFDRFSPAGFIEILAAQKTRESQEWYQGTAHAVRQNLVHLNNHRHQYVLILSGDQLYRMDFRNIMAQHIATGADVTVATIPVIRNDAKGFGIMHIDDDQNIVRFVEKPKEEALLNSLRLGEATMQQMNLDTKNELFLASMGIYVFNRNVLTESLADESKQDFGKDIIPSLLQQKKKVCAYIHQGYWEDIGTIRAYYEANLNLTEIEPKFDFYDTRSPIYSRARFLPASRINESTISQSVISDGCIIEHAHIEHSMIGIRCYIASGVKIKDSVFMGTDFFDNEHEREINARTGRPPLGIGENTTIERAILDKNVRIGKNVTISGVNKTKDEDNALYYVRDGVVIIPKNAVIPDGTVI